MSYPLSLAEGAKIVQLLTPATDAAGRTGAYISMKNYHKAVIICHVAQGNAATVQFTPNQATAVAGTGTKALTSNVRIWSNLDCATNDSLVNRTAAKDYTTDAALKNKIVVFEIDAASLDQANSFDCLTVITGASNAANLTQAIAVLFPRFGQATPPSAVVD